MKLVLLITVAAMSLAGVAIAQVQPNDASADHSVAAARQAHVAALKSKDPAKIAETEEALHHAYEVDAIDHQQTAKYAKLPKDGEARTTALALLQAQDAASDAKLSGDPAAITRTQAELREAYRKNYSATHPKATKK